MIHNQNHWIEHKEWTLRQTMDFGWLWCVYVGSSLEKMSILASDVDNGEAMHVKGWRVYNKSVFSSQFYFKPKPAL